MLAPIVTKDMKLFPSRPLPPFVKNSNVRARAQSLDEIGGSTSQAKPFRQRNAQSVGHLPGVAKSPPKRSSAARTPLDSIKEGVELGASSSSRGKSNATLNNDTADCRSVRSAGSADDKKSPRGSKKIVKWITAAFKKSKDSPSSSSPTSGNDDEQLSTSSDSDNKVLTSSLPESARSSLSSS